jgi:hypothetical protein
MKNLLLCLMVVAVLVGVSSAQSMTIQPTITILVGQTESKFPANPVLGDQVEDENGLWWIFDGLWYPVDYLMPAPGPTSTARLKELIALFDDDEGTLELTVEDASDIRAWLDVLQQKRNLVKEPTGGTQ